MNGVPQILPEELAWRLDQGESLYLLDVREPWEFSHCAIPGSVNLPMGQVPARLDEIPADRPVVCICHHGIRSQQVAGYLHQQGRAQVENLTGGVDAWASDVAPDMPRY